jgi:hypothetical protein
MKFILGGALAIKESIQTRDYCVPKSATLRADRPCPFGFTSGQALQSRKEAVLRMTNN